MSDQRIAGSQDRRIAGSQDRRIEGSKDRRIEGSKDRKIERSKDRRIEGSSGRLGPRAKIAAFFQLFIHVRVCLKSVHSSSSLSFIHSFMIESVFIHDRFIHSLRRQCRLGLKRSRKKKVYKTETLVFSPDSRMSDIRNGV